MAKAHGRVPVSIPSYLEAGWVVEATVAERQRLWENGVRALASLQSVPLDSVDFIGRPELGDGFEQEWDRWRRYFELVTVGHSMPFHDAAWQRLSETRPANRRTGLVWGDARFGNIMFDDEMNVIALMDWEQPSLGGALQDLGWWLFNDRMKVLDRGGVQLDGFGDRAATIALWSELTGLAADDLDWYEAFAGFKMVCLTVHMMRQRGEVPPDGDWAAVKNAREVARMIGLSRADW
jgi:aminoglycoside phosphotransferase (APT) family kinase protein